LVPELHAVGRSILDRDDALEIERKAIAGGMKSRWQGACEAVATGRTSPAEIRRVLGFESHVQGPAPLRSAPASVARERPATRGALGPGRVVGAD